MLKVLALLTILLPASAWSCELPRKGCKERLVALGDR
jgi:hypothetical protein